MLTVILLLNIAMISLVDKFKSLLYMVEFHLNFPLHCIFQLHLSSFNFFSHFICMEMRGANINI
jgi:hypothetical protein